MEETPEERIDALKSETAQLVPKLHQIYGDLNSGDEIKLRRKEMDILSELTAHVADLMRRVAELEKK